ncbi:MAG: aldo/keto reductase [Labilithrix sp.]|nr:aldo/keto reductase [Labilithrix sp.]
MSTDADRDEARALETIRAAFDGGVRLFDTARAYGVDGADEGHNERLVARALSGREGGRVVTKCGMRREGWIPDGRASTIARDAAASAIALGRPLDVLLLHAPDPRTPLVTSVRALDRARKDGVARSIGVSNVSRKQLEEIATVARVDVVEIALGAYDDAAVRGGVVAWCAERGVELLAHSPLGGPARAPRLARDVRLRALAERAGATAHELVLAYLLAVHPSIMLLVGARRANAAASAVAAARIALDDELLFALDARFPGLALLRRPPPRPPETSTREVVILMGIPGAGKSTAAKAYVDRGHVRLNRDTVGGTLAGIAKRLDEVLRKGATGVVLDNTYVSRASRSEVVRIAHTHGAHVRCVHFDTPPHEAQRNVVSRMLERHGALLGPKEIASLSKRDPTALGPNALRRLLGELEAPAPEEGFASVDVVTFTRRHDPRATARGAAIALDAIARRAGDGYALAADARAIFDDLPAGSRALVFGWIPDASPALVASTTALLREAHGAELALCTHLAGPPLCWCRPPLPGLWLAFARAHGLDARASVLVGTGASHASMARALEMTYLERPLTGASSPPRTA